MSDRLDKVPQVAVNLGISRSEARKHIAQGTCPCGMPGVSPCWRMGGDAGCAWIIIGDQREGCE